MGGGWRLCHAARAWVNQCYTTVTRWGVELRVPIALSIFLDLKTRTGSDVIFISLFFCYHCTITATDQIYGVTSHLGMYTVDAGFTAL